MKRAERAGFKAIALTVDTPRLGRREADIKNRYSAKVFILAVHDLKVLIVKFGRQLVFCISRVY